MIGPTKPREVEFAGRGIRPGAMLAAMLFLILPSVVGPFVIMFLDPNETLSIGVFIPSAVWLVIGGFGVWGGVVMPLRRRKLVETGVFTLGEVSSVVGERSPKKVSVSYTADDGVRRELLISTWRPAQPGDRVNVAHLPRRAGEATVVELGDWHVREPGVERPQTLSVGGMLLLLVFMGLGMVGMGVGFGGAELSGERIVVSHPGVFPLVLLAAVGVAVWWVRRRKLPPLAALFTGLTFVAAPMGVLGAGLLVSQALPPRERQVTVVVEAAFCLETSVHGPICLLELRTPPELAALELVRNEGAPTPQVGEVIPLTLSEPLFAPSTIRSAKFRTWDWKPETSIEALFVDKRHPMSDLISAHAIKARGAFSEQSQTRAELDRLGIEREPMSPSP